MLAEARAHGGMWPRQPRAAHRGEDIRGQQMCLSSPLYGKLLCEVGKEMDVTTLVKVPI